MKNTELFTAKKIELMKKMPNWANKKFYINGIIHDSDVLDKNQKKSLLKELKLVDNEKDLMKFVSTKKTITLNEMKEMDKKEKLEMMNKKIEETPKKNAKKYKGATESDSMFKMSDVKAIAKMNIADAKSYVNKLIDGAEEHAKKENIDKAKKMVNRSKNTQSLMMGMSNFILAIGGNKVIR